MVEAASDVRQFDTTYFARQRLTAHLPGECR
jgi:hypothetical protein